MKVTLTPRDVHQALQKYVQANFGEHMVIADTDFIITRKPRTLSVAVDIVSMDEISKNPHVPEAVPYNPEPKEAPAKFDPADCDEQMEAPLNEPVSDQEFAEAALATPTPDLEEGVAETQSDSLFN